MKKTPLLAMLFALIANFAMAQPPSLNLSEPIDTSSITTSSITVEAQQFNGDGSWYVQAQPQQVGTTVWIEGDTTPYFGSNQHVTEVINNLSDSTNYWIRLVIYDSAHVAIDTLYYTDIVTTKPLPRHAQILSVDTLPMLPTSGYKVVGSVIGQPGIAWAVHATSFGAVTDTIPYNFTSGAGYVDTLRFLSDSANMVHPAVRIYMKGLTDNWVTSSAIIPGFKTPGYTNPVMNSSNLVITKDSIFVNLNILSKGNTDDSLLSVTITDTVGNTIVYQTLAASFTVGTIPVKKGGLHSNNWYHFTAVATNKANRSAIVSFSFKTSNVLPGTVVASVPTGTTGYTDYTVKGFIDSKGTGDSSAVIKAWLLEGSAAVDSQSLNITDTATITFHQTNKLSGHLYSGVKVKIVNGANLSTTSNVLNITTLTAITPVITNNTPVKTHDSVSVTINTVTLGAPTNPTLVYFIRDTLGPIVYIDSQTITGVGSKVITKGGLISNHWYYFSAILTNSLGLADTIAFWFKTNNVIAPTASVSQGPVSYTSYIAKAFINPKWLGDSSTVDRAYIYEGNSIVDSFTTLGLTDTATVPFLETGKISGNTYTVKVKAVNRANLSYTSAAINITTTPTVLPTLSNGSLVKTPDSVSVPITVSAIGNGGIPTIVIWIQDTLGPIVYSHSQTVTVTGNILVTQGGLLSNHWYHLTAIMTNPLGLADTVSFSFKTPNVSGPSVVTDSSSVNYTEYIAKVSVSALGVYDSSVITKIELYEDNLLVDVTNVLVADTFTWYPHEYNKAIGHTYSLKAKAYNLANLVTVSAPVNITTKPVIMPAMTNSTPTKTTDSIYTSLSITNLGNGGAVNLNKMLKDVLTGTLVMNTSQAVTSTGNIPVPKGGLMSNRVYEFTAVLFNTYGSADTVTFLVKTDNVTAPKATVAVGAPAGYYDYTVDVFVNPQGQWDSSEVKKLYLYESSSSSTNGTIIDSADLMLTDTGTISFHKTGKQASTDYWMKAKVINLAGLSYLSTPSVKVSTQTMAPDGDPYIAAAFADDASTLRATGMTYNVNPAHNSNIRLKRENLTTQGVDTVDVLFGVTGTGSIAQKIMTDAIGDNTYRLTIFSESNEGIVWGNYKQQHMPSPEPNPTLADVTKGNASDPAHAIAINVFGDRGGNACTMSIHWYLNNVEQTANGSPFVTTNLPGTFNYPYLITNLLPSTTYKIIVELDAAGGGAANPITRQYTTDAATGIEEVTLSVTTIKSTQVMTVWNSVGQLVVDRGDFQNALPLMQQHPGVYVVVLYDEQGKAVGRGKLPVF